MGKNGVCLVKRLKYPLFLGLQVDLQLASQTCTSQIFANDLLQQHYMESNDTQHGSELVPHWVLGPNNSNFGPMGTPHQRHFFLDSRLLASPCKNHLPVDLPVRFLVAGFFHY